MATLSLSSPVAYQGGTVVSSDLFGYDGSKYRVVRYTFRTGAAGATKVTLSGYITKYSGNYDVSSVYKLLFKITTDPDSHKNATKGSSYDGQITSTSVNVSVNMQLKANTTYYLWLFSGHSSYSLYYAYSGSTPTLSVVTEVTSYRLTTTAGTGSSITVTRTSSPLGGASTGTIGSGATIYLNDVLQITTSASGGYKIESQTCNGSSFASGDSKTVTSAITIVTVTALMGLVHIDNGTKFEAYLIFIDNGTKWEQYIPYVDNGSGWNICS